MVRLHQKVLLLAANMLVPIGALIFMTGFFRGRPSTPTPSEIIPDREIVAPFNKVVFMVIDALRRSVFINVLFGEGMPSVILISYSDFVYAENSGFTFTQE